MFDVRNIRLGQNGEGLMGRETSLPLSSLPELRLSHRQTASPALRMASGWALMGKFAGEFGSGTQT
jgi:hypothetical protein